MGGQEVAGADRHQPDGTAPSQGLRLTRDSMPAKLLKDRDMDPNRADNHCQTPLHCGQLGHEGVLMRLLGRDDAELNRVNNEGLTPLARARWVGIIRRDGEDAARMPRPRLKC